MSDEEGDTLRPELMDVLTISGPVNEKSRSLKMGLNYCTVFIKMSVSTKIQLILKRRTHSS